MSVRSKEISIRQLVVSLEPRRGVWDEDMDLEVISIISIWRHRRRRDYQGSVNVENFEHKVEKEQDIYTVSKYLSKDHLVIYIGKNDNSTVKKPGRCHLSKLIKVNTINNGTKWHHVFPHLVHWGHTTP